MYLIYTTIRVDFIFIIFDCSDYHRNCDHSKVHSPPKVMPTAYNLLPPRKESVYASIASIACSSTCIGCRKLKRA